MNRQKSAILRRSSTGPKKAPLKRRIKRVYVIGAGFSAGLGFPMISNLLIEIWERLDQDFKVKLTKVIKFHHPQFRSKDCGTFPTVETLLTEMQINEKMFDASRPAEGNFKLRDLLAIRRELLLSIAKWFHEIHSSIERKRPDWLEKFVDELRSESSVAITFNWDLVLEWSLFGKDICSADYGLENKNGDSPIIIKPHGSLNWFAEKTASKLSERNRFTLFELNDRQVFVFRPFRAPRSKRRKYMPLIVPPVFSKDFGFELWQELWRKCVSALSTATEVYFLGYSQADADIHARFMIRCGFHNQVEGEIRTSGGRKRATGPAKVFVVNPDKQAFLRIKDAVGTSAIVKWEEMKVSDWVGLR